MIINYKTPEAEERHVDYSIEGNFLTVDYLSMKLDRYEKDDPVHIDICQDKMGNLSTGVIPGWSEKYIAQVDIPARTYHEEETEETNEDGEKITIPVPDPYDPGKTTLTLWETEE